MGKNAGDTLTLYLDYTVDGEQIAEGQFDEIEVSIGSKRYLLTDNEIVWDSEADMYKLWIDQADTFTFNKDTKYQIRFKFGNDVISTDKANLKLGESISRQVI